MGKKKVIQRDKHTLEEIAIFDSISEAAESTGVHCGSISNCLNKRYKTAGGFVWNYVSKPQLRKVEKPAEMKCPNCEGQAHKVSKTTFYCWDCGAELYINRDRIIVFKLHKNGNKTELFRVVNGVTISRDLKKERYIIQSDPKTYEVVGEYEDIKTASLRTGLSYSNIQNCISGRSKTAGGYIWNYSN